MGIISSRGNPCTPDCQDRKVGCAIDCSKWAAYVQKRNADYVKRLDAQRLSDAICDGFVRVGRKKPPMK